MESEARIEEIIERSGKKARIRISRKLFHPSGGGQPGDSGHIEGRGFRAEVVDSHAGADGDILEISVKEGDIPLGGTVFVTVDPERHRLLSRMHTGEHILSRALENQMKGLFVEKVAIGEHESTVYMTYDGKIGWDDLFRAEETANRVISGNLPVKKNEVSREERERFKGVKIKWDRIPDEVVSVVSIDGYDSIACSGSHVNSTGEVGGVLITGFKGSSPDWEVRYCLERQDILEKHSRIIRVLSRDSGCDPEALPAFLDRIREERRESSRRLDKARKYIVLPWELVQDRPVRSYFFAVENFPVELAAPAVKRKLEEDPASIVLFLSQEEGGKGANFIIAAGDEAKGDLCWFLKQNSELKAKGGGTDRWIQGRSANGSSTDWKKAALSNS